MPNYGYKVVFAEPELLAENGFGVLSNQPFIFDSEPGYAKLPNQFLIDRALGVWDPRERGKKRVPPPSRISMRDYAYWFVNALEWADAREVDLMMADYSSILIGRYQQEMLTGVWSADGRKLSGNTANPRVQIALEYQMWGADKGLREPVSVPTITTPYVPGSHDNSKSHEVKYTQSRRGKIKVKKRTLSLPSNEQVKEWRNRVHQRPVHGHTEGLIVDLILNTAIRREEAASWRVDTLPVDPKEWEIANPDEPEQFQNVLVTLRYGTKGKEYGIDEHGDKIGPQDTIHVPLWIARRIHAYRNTERLLALKPLIGRGKTAASQRQALQRAVHLFVHRDTGKRYTGDQIYSFWTSVEATPERWSPHRGRDWWACRYLEERMKQHADLIEHILKIPNLTDDHPMMLELRDTAQTIIQLEIKPQLRHARTDTTELYLRWLFSKLRIPLNLTQQWAALDDCDAD